MDALRIMGLGATPAPLPDSTLNYKIPVPVSPTPVAEVPWWQKALSITEQVFEVGKPIVDQFTTTNKGGAFNPSLPANGGFVPPPAPTFWAQHGTKIIVGTGLALATGTGIFLATRKKKRKNLGSLAGMNARIASEINDEMVKDLLTSSKEMAKRMGITISQAIDKKVKVYEKYAKNNNEAAAWYIRGEDAKKLLKKK